MNDKSIIFLRYMHVRDMIEDRFFKEKRKKDACVHTMRGKINK